MPYTQTFEVSSAQTANQGFPPSDGMGDLVAAARFAGESMPDTSEVAVALYTNDAPQRR